jgi:hypothetical protein
VVLSIPCKAAIFDLAARLWDESSLLGLFLSASIPFCWPTAVLRF